jgi:hypothetical protein
MNLNEQAHDYHLAGFNPIPLKMDKSPSLPAGENYLRQFVSTEWIDQHFTNAEKIGVACGDVSGNLLCIDFDMHNEGENVHEVFELFTNTPHVKHLIDTKQVAVYSTPSGGRHIIYRTPETERSKKLARYSHGAVMIETRGEGGYIACYPSQGYDHMAGCNIIEVGELDDEAHVFLMSLAVSFTEKELEPVVEDKRNPDAKWGERWDINTPEGKYNIEEGDSAFKLLLDNGWQVNTLRPARQGITNLTRPGKSIEDGISATWGFQKNMFYVFTESSNDFPVPERANQNVVGKGYNPFDILVRLEYGGDWKAAKDALREVYGMKSKQTVKSLPKLEEDRLTKVTDFPIEVFNDDIRNFILQMQRALNFSPDISACGIMSAISTLAGNTVRLRVKNGWTTPMVFWFMARGLPGTNKSHPINTALQPLKKINKSNFDTYRAQIAELNMIDDKEKKNYPTPQFHQVVVDDVTVESLRNVLSVNPRGVLLHNDEIKKFIDSMNQYKGGGGSDEAFWLTSFNNGEFTVNRVKSDPVVITNLFINIIGTIQPDVLSNIATKSENNGFLDRFLFTRAETYAHGVNDEEVDMSTFGWWDKFCNMIHETCEFQEDNPVMAEFTPGAYWLYKDIAQEYADMQNDESNTITMRSYISKLRIYVTRFALLFSFIDHMDPNVNQPTLNIEKHHVEKGKKVCDYFLATAEEVFIENVEKKEASNVDPKTGSNQERIIAMIDKKIAQKVIAETIGCSPAYVSKVKKSMQNG